jgi:hypothetical protein
MSEEGAITGTDTGTNTETNTETTEKKKVNFDSPLPFMSPEEDQALESQEKETKENTEEESPEEKKPSDWDDSPPEVETLIFNNEMYEVPKDCTVQVKVAGKLYDIPLEELKSNYAGKQYYDKKLSEVDLKSKQVQREKEQIEAVLSNYSRLLADDPISALSLGFEASGLDEETALRKVYATIIKEATNFIKMDEQAQVAFLEKKLLDRKRNQIEGEKRKLTQERTQAEQERWISSELQARGKTWQDFANAFETYNRIAEQNPVLKLDPSSPIEEQAKRVLSFMDESEKFIQVASIAEKYQAPEEVLFDVFDVIKANKLDPSDADYFFKELLGKRDRKAEKASPKPKAGPQKETKPSEEEEWRKRLKESLKSPLPFMS